MEASLDSHDLERGWDRIAPELPGKVGDPGATARDNRLFVEAVLWIARTVRPGVICHRRLATGSPSTPASGAGRRRACGSAFSTSYRTIPILNASFSMRRMSGSISMEPAQKGTRKQAIGTSRGGLTTKIAALVDALGNLVRFVLLPGHRHDITSFDALMAGVSCLALIGESPKTFVHFA